MLHFIMYQHYKIQMFRKFHLQSYIKNLPIICDTPPARTSYCLRRLSPNGPVSIAKLGKASGDAVPLNSAPERHSYCLEATVLGSDRMPSSQSAVRLLSMIN